jgi:hypothetical protein
MNLAHNCYGSQGLACASHEYATWPWTALFGGEDRDAHPSPLLAAMQSGSRMHKL